MTNPDYKLQLHQNKIKRILFAALPIYILSEKWIKSVSNEAYLEAQRISTNLTQTARQLMLNAIYKNETNVIFSLKLNDEAAHGKFFENELSEDYNLDGLLNINWTGHFFRQN